MGVPTSKNITLSISGSSDYTSFANNVASQLDIANNTGVTINVRVLNNKGVAGVALPIKDGQLHSVHGITNTNQVQCVRESGSGVITIGGVFYG